MDCLTIEKGDRFSSLDDFKIALKLSIIKKFSFVRTYKSDKSRVIYKCVDPSCEFSVKCVYSKVEGCYIVKDLNIEHNCDHDMQSANAKMKIGELYLKERRPTSCNAFTLMQEVSQNYGMIISYSAAQKAILKFYGKDGLAMSKDLSKLPSFKDSFIRDNGYCLLDESMGQFSRIALCWHTSIQFFEHSRKLLYLGETFLSSSYRGVLLMVVGQDSNDGCFLLAVAIVDAGNVNNWNWFLSFLNSHLIKDREVTFISDQEAGIINSVETIWGSSAKHLFCCRYIATNLKSRFRCKMLDSLFWKAAHTFSDDVFVSIMQDIRSLSEEMAEYLEAIGPSRWASSQLESRRFNKLTNDGVESINAAIKKFKEYSFTKLLVSLNNFVLSKLSVRQRAVFQGNMVPMVENLLSENTKEALGFYIYQKDNNRYQVSEYVVDLSTKTCSCGLFQELMIPCSHAIAAIQLKGESFYTYISPIYSVSSYKESYNSRIEPMIHETLQTSSLQVSGIARSRGRPRKKKIRPASDGASKPKRFCRNCGMEGHYQRTCGRINDVPISLVQRMF